MRVLLVGNYEADGQQSMQRFAVLMERLLRARNCDVHIVRPLVLAGLIPAPMLLKKWLGYVDKFVIFPIHLRRAARWADVVHICDHSSAMYVKHVRSKPHAITCHDLLAVRSALGEIAENSTRWTGRRLQSMVTSGLRNAQHIVCISDATREDLIRVFAIPNDRTSRIYNGLNYPFCPMPAEEAIPRLRRIGVDVRQPFILHVGGNQWYKNRLGVLRIFRELRARCPGVRLVMVGKPWTAKMREFAVQQDLSRSVHEVTQADEEDLRACYSTAALLLFPSLQEGFGWPVIEAQACGCTVVTSNRAPLTEVGGAAATYVNPEDVKGAAALVAEVLMRSSTPESERRNLENAARFPADSMIEAYIDVFKRVTREKRFNPRIGY